MSVYTALYKLQLHKLVAKLQEPSRGWWLWRIYIKSPGAGKIAIIFQMSSQDQFKGN